MSIDYFPESANANDSMADYYESEKDTVNALKYVTKAFEISGKAYYKNRLEELKSNK